MPSPAADGGARRPSSTLTECRDVMAVAWSRCVAPSCVGPRSRWLRRAAGYRPSRQVAHVRRPSEPRKGPGRWTPSGEFEGARGSRLRHGAKLRRAEIERRLFRGRNLIGRATSPECGSPRPCDLDCVDDHPASDPIASCSLLPRPGDCGARSPQNLGWLRDTQAEDQDPPVSRTSETPASITRGTEGHASLVAWGPWQSGAVVDGVTGTSAARWRR